MSKHIKVLSGVLVAVALAACQDPLTVGNTNNPNRPQVLGRASDVEALIAGTFKTVINGTFGTDGLGPSARTMAWENASNLANWGLGPRSALPRAPLDNSRGNPYQGENQADFNALQRAARGAADGLHSFLVGKLDLGSNAQNARAVSFGWFSLGTALGYVALDYDSAAIINPYDSLLFVADLSGYAEVNVAALAALDSAIAWATTAKSASGANGFPLPSTWINGNAAINADTMIAIARSYKAYFRANVARTPADRTNNVDWASVRDDAAAGIRSTLTVSTGAGSGWTVVGNQWWLYAQWGQLNQMIGGQADSTGAYDAWLATPNYAKVQFLIRTSDLRFPSGDTRTAQIANSPSVPTGTKLYFRNRTSSDPDAAPWSSYYDWYRMLPWYKASRVGPYPIFTKAQNDLLQAEALLQLGDIPGAAALIDLTRTYNGLPALTGVIATATDPVPGGNACVPHVPDPAQNYTASKCGNIMDALKWEYRMETMFVSYISQYFSGRGWGDLPQGTPYHWPVPYNEMDTRGLPFYNMGGVNLPGGTAGVGTFGF